MRQQLARALLKLAVKVDGREGIGYSITHHIPQGWEAWTKMGGRPHA